ncbi:hypothetical protein L7F22_004884, partial [Adiantum nelumboides]|nr:hypothetical protein [Adiantum nelumboides]
MNDHFAHTIVMHGKRRWQAGRKCSRGKVVAESGQGLSMARKVGDNKEEDGDNGMESWKYGKVAADTLIWLNVYDREKPTRARDSGV